MEFIKPGTQWDFMGKRWYFIGLSLSLLVLSIISFIVPGPKLGTDFKGGTEVEIAFTQPISAADVRESVHKIGFADPDVVSVEDKAHPNRFLIRVQEVSALSEAEKDLIRGKMCLAPENGTLPADRCPENVLASEIKFSPGGDKITSRYETAPNLAGIRAQLAGTPGIELRAGQNNPIVVSERDHKVEIQLKSKADQLLDGLRGQLGADKVPQEALR